MSDTPHPRQDTTPLVPNSTPDFTADDWRELITDVANGFEKDSCGREPGELTTANNARALAAYLPTLFARVASLESDLAEARTEAETFSWAFYRLCDETESRKRTRGALRVREGKQFVSYHRGRVVEVCDTHEEADASLELIRQNFPADDVSVMTFEVSALPSREVPKE